LRPFCWLDARTGETQRIFCVERSLVEGTQGEKTETAEADAFIDDEGSAREEGDAKSMPVDETRDDDEGRDREDAGEDDDAEGRAESRGIED
jgi:hypothetical protein